MTESSIAFPFASSWFVAPFQDGFIVQSGISIRNKRLQQGVFLMIHPAHVKYICYPKCSRLTSGRLIQSNLACFFTTERRHVTLVFLSRFEVCY